MKIAVAFLVIGLCAFASTSAVEEQSGQSVNPQYQKDVLIILSHINQPSYYSEFVDIGNKYNVSQNANQYSNQEAVQQFVQYYNYGLLPRGEVFSVFYQYQLNQAIALFKILYYAKDYQTFYKTAVWARQNLNEGLFLYAFTVAVVHREDTQNVVLPPIYEVYPYYFINSETIQQAYIYKQQYNGQSGQGSGNNVYTINNYNYSGYYLNLEAEQSLSYYLEDVGINSFYYYYNIYYPFWLSSQEYGFQYVNRGEQYYFLYQQLLARYYLERISNGFGEIPFISWDSVVETPYYPSLQYPNGLQFPSRPAYARLSEYFYNYGQRWTTVGVYGYSPILVQDYERRINDAIDSGVVYSHGQLVDLYTPQGLNILGNLIQGNQDSPNYRYYGALWLYASHLLGYSYQPLNYYQIAPSALEQFETALRDPVFYQLYKRVILKFQRYYSNIAPYSSQDLVFPGVKISQFKVDRLTTYDDDFYVDISNAVYYSEQEQQQEEKTKSFGFDVRVRQSRLNNKPFTYKITVQSEQETQSVVKVFLAPIYDEYGRYINLTENRLNMVLLDYFVYDLKSGENIINRNSYDSPLYAKDPISYHELWRQYGTSQGQQSQQSQQYYFYYPQRYLLPKGSSSGVPYQFYAIVYPYVPKPGQQQPSGSNVYESYYYPFVGNQQFYDNYTLGYPFDRFIQYEQLYYQVPNSYFYQTRIYHTENVNVVQSD